MKINTLIGFILFVITQFSYSQNTKTEEVITIEEYGSSLDEFDYARYVENRDISYLKRELGNTGVFYKIENLGNRKYFCVYTVYILPNDVNEVTRDLSDLSVKSFEKWKEYEIQKEIKRRENESSLEETLTELHPKLKQVYEKYIDKIISNNRELMLGYVLGFIKSEIFDITKDNVKEWETSDYKILPNDDFIKFIDNPQHIEPKSYSGGVYYDLQVNVVRGEKTLINLPFNIYNINDDWSYLNFQIGSKSFELDISNYTGPDVLRKRFLEKVKLINKIKDDYKIIEVSYNNFTNYGLRNHIKKLQKSFDKLSSEFNELVSSEFNYFDFGSSNEVWYPSNWTIFRGSGFFKNVDYLKQIAENNKIEVLDFNFNPTKNGRLELNKLKFPSDIGVQLDYLKNRLKNELKFHIENEKVLDNVVDKCSNYMIKNYLTIKNIGGVPSDYNIKIFELIEIIKSNNSKLTFKVENSYRESTNDFYNVKKEGTNFYLGVLYADRFWWKIDFKKMKLEHYSVPNSTYNFRPFKQKLTSIDLN